MNHSSTLKPSLQKRQKRRDKRLHEELIECYREGGRWSGNKRKGYDKYIGNDDFANQRKTEGMKVRNGGTKWQNDNLKPLIRFLQKHEGKYWDKVHSQLCKKMDKNTLLGQHVFQHLFDFVEIKVSLEEGKVIGYSSYGSPEELVEYWYPQFYVHPKSGQLIRVKKKWSSR